MFTKKRCAWFVASSTQALKACPPRNPGMQIKSTTKALSALLDNIIQNDSTNLQAIVNLFLINCCTKHKTNSQSGKTRITYRNTRQILSETECIAQRLHHIRIRLYATQIMNYADSPEDVLVQVLEYALAVYLFPRD